MVTEQEYLKAKKVVEDYNEQVRISNIAHNEKIKKEQLKREEECGEHYYVPDKHKYATTSSCTFCGKTIE